MKSCELCKSPARTFCESDEASLCWSCDAKVHGANFLVARHSRTLLCHFCQSLTPWQAAGAKLGHTISYCSRCSNGDTDEGQLGEAEEVDDDEDEEEDEEESGSEGDELEEEDGDCGDNQVVPWSSAAAATPPPPPDAESSSSSSAYSSDSESGESVQSCEVVSTRRKRNSCGADLCCLLQDDVDGGNTATCVDETSRPLKIRRSGSAAGMDLE